MVAGLKTRIRGATLAYLRRCFTVDTRSLAVFRMGVAVLIVADVLLRARNFGLYYTDDGVLPQHLTELYLRDGAVSVFFFTQDPRLIAGLFALHALVAVVLFVGYRTRLMLIVSFVLVISLDHHNPLVLSYADTLFRMLLFWAIFLPLGERWSIDALQRDRDPRAAVASLATAAIMGQMVLMYAINGLRKYPSDRWHSGEAAIIVMGSDHLTFLLGNATRSVPSLLQVGGRLWFFLLLGAPLLILLSGRARYPYLALLVAGHLSFALTVRIGAFPYVALLGLLAFVQPRLWQDTRAVLPAIVGNRFAAGMRRGGEHIARALPRPLVRIPERDRLARGAITLILLVAVLGLLVHPGVAMAAEATSVGEDRIPAGNPVDDVAANWGVAQSTWTIFANPGPSEYDRYYVFPAKTEDGEVFDIYNEREMTYDRPGRHLHRGYDTYRERFFMNVVRGMGDDTLLSESFSQHLCDRWSEDHGVEIRYINMYEVREEITVDTIDDPDNRSTEVRLIAMTQCDTRGGTIFAPPEEYGMNE